jgi:putative hemolysin
MPLPLITLLLSFGAAAIAAVSFAGDVACTSLSGAHLAALAESSPQFARLHAHRPRIQARWLTARVIALAIVAASLADLAEGPMRLLFAGGGTFLLYGVLAEVLGTVAKRSPERMGLLALRILRPTEWATFLLADPIAMLGRAVASRIPENRMQDARITENEVALAVSAGERSGAIAGEPAEMIRNVLEFKDLTVQDVMVPRKRVAAIELSTPVKAALEMVAGDGHSRYPVFQGTLDNVVGLLYAKDLFALVSRARDDAPLEELIRKPVLVVIESQSALSVLREMRGRRQHLAIVSDEFGGTEGIVTLEDILEEIVGEIRDEYDTDAAIHELGEGRILVEAAIALAEVEAHLKTSFGHDEVESIAGLILNKTGKVPDVGASVVFGDYRFVIKEADDTRIIKVEIIKGAGRPRPSRPDDVREPLES